jgi:hypothetical protein
MVKPFPDFNPHRIAYWEKENYVSYYLKRWPKLLIASIGMVKETYRLSLPKAVYGAYLVARAEIAYAPFPDNDRPTALAYMRRFFILLKNTHGLAYDSSRMAEVNVNWWDVHREGFAKADHTALVEALADDYSLFFSLDRQQVLPAAGHRAQAMYYSDLWVRGGCEPGSPLLAQEEEELALGYTALREALLRARSAMAVVGAGS